MFQVIDETYNGRKIELATGEMIELRLPENRTTGFRWAMSSDGAPACFLVHDHFEPSGKVPGRGGNHFWQFRAVTPGAGVIRLTSKRPWEEHAAQEFQLLIEVKS